MNGPQKLALTTTLATAALVGCSTPTPVQPASPERLQASFPALRETFRANFPKATAIAGTDLPLSAEVAGDGFQTTDTARSDFLRWCSRSGGMSYRDLALAKPPQDVARAMNTGTAILKQAAQNSLYSSAPAACATASRTYVLAMGARRVGQGGGYVGNSVLAWLTPDEIAAKGPAALQAEAQQQQERREQAARTEATRQAAAAKTYQDAMGRKAQFLKGSPLGTQRSCSAYQQQGRNLNELQYECGDNGYIVLFDEFSQYGWRITSQMGTPAADVIGRPGTRVTLIVEKTR